MYNRIYKGKIYRFLDFNGARITIMEQKLRLTRPDVLNDPLDCSSLIIKEAVKKSAIQIFTNQRKFDSLFEKNEFKRKQLELVEKGSYQNEEDIALQTIVDNLFIASFSKNYDTTNSFLMWSHYADKHSGICIEFDFQGFIEKSEERCFTPFIPMETYYVKPLQKAKSGDIVDLMEPWLLQKLSCWEYENELRLVVRKDELLENSFSLIEEEKDEKKYVKIDIPLNSITKIIFGWKANKDEIESLKLFCQKNEICKNFEQMVINSKTLEFEKRDV